MSSFYFKFTCIECLKVYCPKCLKPWTQNTSLGCFWPLDSFKKWFTWGVFDPLIRLRNDSLGVFLTPWFVQEMIHLEQFWSHIRLRNLFFFKSEWMYTRAKKVFCFDNCFLWNICWISFDGQEAFWAFQLHGFQKRQNEQNDSFFCSYLESPRTRATK